MIKRIICFLLLVILMFNIYGCKDKNVIYDGVENSLYIRSLLIIDKSDVYYERIFKTPIISALNNIDYSNTISEISEDKKSYEPFKIVIIRKLEIIYYVFYDNILYVKDPIENIDNYFEISQDEYSELRKQIDEIVKCGNS